MRMEGIRRRHDKCAYVLTQIHERTAMQRNGLPERDTSTHTYAHLGAHTHSKLKHRHLSLSYTHLSVLCEEAGVAHYAMPLHRPQPIRCGVRDVSVSE